MYFRWCFLRVYRFWFAVCECLHHDVPRDVAFLKNSLDPDGFLWVSISYGCFLGMFRSCGCLQSFRFWDSSVSVQILWCRFLRVFKSWVTLFRYSNPKLDFRVLAKTNPSVVAGILKSSFWNWQWAGHPRKWQLLCRVPSSSHNKLCILSPGY